MTELEVRTDDPTPPYEQLRRQLVGMIRAGDLPVGERLPPLRQLAGDLGLAVGTVARTYRELEAAGLIVSRRGGGTRVAVRPDEAAGSRPENAARAAPGGRKPAGDEQGPGAPVPDGSRAGVPVPAVPSVGAEERSSGASPRAGADSGDLTGTRSGPGGGGGPEVRVSAVDGGVAEGRVAGVRVAAGAADALRYAAEAFVRQGLLLGADRVTIAEAFREALAAARSGAVDNG